jgi:glycoprotein-N-acetylgalactosamine 3-beta-galactosyltransferase
MTMPENHDKKAKHVKATWGRRCNVLVFISSEADPNLPTINVQVTEGRSNLWSKTRKGFAYMYENYKDEADWFLKADDDTYTVVENLRYMLQPYDATEPIYFGCKFKPFISQGWMSGGAGYVLSKEALRRFVKQGLTDETGLICRSDEEGLEDVEIGKCMENLGVKAGDSRDSLGRGRFFPSVPEQQIFPVQKWSWYYPAEEGMACCSDSAVSFHYVPPNQMYVMEYLLYHLRPYGIHSMVHSNGPDKASSTTTPSFIGVPLIKSGYNASPP